MGGSGKEAEQKIRVFQIIITIQYLTSPPGLLFLLVRTSRGAVSLGAFSSLLREGGQRALICYSESKGTCWLRLALLTFVVQPRALAGKLFLPEKSAAASNLHRWQGQLQQAHQNRWGLNPNRGREIIVRAGSFGVGFKPMGKCSKVVWQQVATTELRFAERKEEG